MLKKRVTREKKKKKIDVMTSFRDALLFFHTSCVFSTLVQPQTQDFCMSSALFVENLKRKVFFFLFDVFFVTQTHQGGGERS